MRTMKRNLFLSVIIVMAMACLAFAFAVNVGAIKAVKADEPVVEPPALAKTNFSVSNNGDYILIATPVTGDFNADLVYEVGYKFTGTQPTIVQASTKQYYTTINGKGAKTLFGDPYTDETPMIVWEIENDSDAVFTATAYFKIGEMDEDVLYKKEPEEIVEGTERNLKVHTVTFEMGDGAAISPIKVDYGTAASTLYDLDITPPAGSDLVKWQLKTGEDEYEDVAAQTITENTTVKAVYEVGGGNFRKLWDKTVQVYQTEYAAGTIVHVTMNMWLEGSATAEDSGGEGVANMLIKSYAEAGTVRANTFSTALISHTSVPDYVGGWTEVEFDACVQAGGWICLHLQKMADNSNTAYKVSVQNVNIVAAGFGGDIKSNWYQIDKIAETDFDDGTMVHVRLSVWLDGSAVDNTNLFFGSYTNTTQGVGGSTTVASKYEVAAMAGDWAEFEYDACVRDGGKVYLLARIEDNSANTYYFMGVKDVEVAHTVTFEMGDGTAISPITAEHGATLSTVLSSVSVTPPAYHYFDKWQLKTGESTYEDVAAQTVTNNITVKAVYEINSYTITFEMGDGTAISPITAEHGATLSTVLSSVSVTPPAYHYFDKWQLKTGESTYEDVAAQTVTGDITVKAIYEMGVCGDFADEPSATRWNTPKNIYHTDYVVGATVRVRMSVWLGGSAVTNSALTIWVCDRANLSAYYKLVDATEVSTWANQWKEVEFDAMIQAGGDIVFKLISGSNDYTEYVVKVKDVEVGFGKDLSSSGGNQVNTVAQTDLATGTSVHVSMSVLVDKTTATDIKNLWFGYHTNGSGGYTWITGGSTLVQNIANSGTWQTLEYDTYVQDGGKVCLLAVLNSTSNAGYYFMQVKDVVVTQK